MAPDDRKPGPAVWSRLNRPALADVSRRLYQWRDRWEQFLRVRASGGSALTKDCQPVGPISTRNGFRPSLTPHIPPTWLPRVVSESWPVDLSVWTAGGRRFLRLHRAPGGSALIEDCQSVERISTENAIRPIVAPAYPPPGHHMGYRGAASCHRTDRTERPGTALGRRRGRRPAAGRRAGRASSRRRTDTSRGILTASAEQVRASHVTPTGVRPDSDPQTSGIA